ncbi:MAG: domain protein putative component of TonB system, partial [Myxococcaceae bacterium]|nr:domain protein putative component of TonB system [Myxococcaceae bacterium]
MTDMEGEGRAPKPTGPQQPREREDVPTGRFAGRATLESIDLEDVEAVPASVDDVSDDIDIEFDEAAAERGSVDKLLAMTGENWSIDAQRESLKEAAKDKSPTEKETERRDEARPNAKPSLSIPTPYDFGGTDLITDIPSNTGPATTGPLGQTPRSIPPPLPGAAASASTSTSVAPPPLPAAGKPGTRPSVPPPPLPARDRNEDTGGA